MLVTLTGVELEVEVDDQSSHEMDELEVVPAGLEEVVELVVVLFAGSADCQSDQLAEAMPARPSARAEYEYFMLTVVRCSDISRQVCK